MDREQAQAYLQSRILDHYDRYGYGLLAAIHKSQLIGFAGLISQTIDGEEKTELAFRFHPDLWGQGLATEASLAICHYAFEELGIPELISIIDPQNTRSLALAKRIGMRHWKDTVYNGFSVGIFRLFP